ncbi:hypothetical protein HDF19_09910 [Mucilaginibacter sp. E4BP6]|uniref:hypothetical protein n=1 Tax=Mucilaginibacter sp. E4BP6 TaxID=2723089 RepID=UPI0015CABFFD|nr:hypothetical protein [Mucilaginibacter sp. E4BP6]NYE67788.1 hypothetical protein [Mucilaginibacter sp. E4BP6]
MIDLYFRKPLLWDYLLATLLCIIIFVINNIGWIFIPVNQNIWSMASDLSTTSLTLAGFIITLLTILITFKSGYRIKKGSKVEDETVFELFFTTNLYFETVKHLKNCIKSLVFISVLGYSLKLFLNDCAHKYIYFFNIFGLIVVILTLLRSLMILTKIIDLQKLE